MESGKEKMFRGNAWDYYTFHARQRLASQRVFLAFASILGLAAVLLMRESTNPALVTVLGAVVILLSLLFWQLDHRLWRAVKSAEDALSSLDSQHGLADAKDGGPNVLRIVERKNMAPKSRSVFPLGDGGLGESQAIRGVYAVFVLMGGVLVGLAWFGKVSSASNAADPLKIIPQLNESLRPAMTPLPTLVPRPYSGSPGVPQRTGNLPFATPQRFPFGTPPSRQLPARTPLPRLPGAIGNTSSSVPSALPAISRPIANPATPAAANPASQNGLPANNRAAPAANDAAAAPAAARPAATPAANANSNPGK